jgi:hypothetical protein
MLSRSTQALLAGNALLAAIVMLQVLLPAAPAADAMELAPDSELAMPEFADVSLNPPALSALSEMIERPLLVSSRRPPEPEEVEPPPPPKPIRLKLIGVALSGGTRVALLRNLVNNQLVHLAEGETHDGWSLDTLGAQSASFSRGPQVAELPLELESHTPKRR